MTITQIKNIAIMAAFALLIVSLLVHKARLDAAHAKHAAAEQRAELYKSNVAELLGALQAQNNAIKKLKEEQDAAEQQHAQALADARKENQAAQARAASIMQREKPQGVEECKAATDLFWELTQ
jgi:hypothetical protein